MAQSKILKQKIDKYIKNDDINIVTREIEDIDISILKIRDNLLKIGDIVEEDRENNIYLAQVRAGMFNKNAALVGVELSGNNIHIISYAKEGIIKQNTATKAIEKVVSIMK